VWMQGAVHDFETGEGVICFHGDGRLPYPQYECLRFIFNGGRTKN
jgi:hypothetical protein